MKIPEFVPDSKNRDILDQLFKKIDEILNKPRAIHTLDNRPPPEPKSKLLRIVK